MERCLVLGYWYKRKLRRGAFMFWGAQSQIDEAISELGWAVFNCVEGSDPRTRMTCFQPNCQPNTIRNQDQKI
jgi:hypothetical protein